MEMNFKRLTQTGLLFIALLEVPLADVRAQSPSSIGGRTIQLAISSGSGPFASGGAYRFLPSATDNSYATVPISGPIAATFGTHTYTKTGTNTAQLSFTDSLAGTATANYTFITAYSGTYVMSSIAFPGSSQIGTFFLFSGTSPISLAGLDVIVTITSGAAPFASNGNYEFRASLSGNTYTIIGFSGVANSSGSFSYAQTSTMTGIISFSDSITGAGFSSQLSFDSETTGTLFLRQTSKSGYQTGTFTITYPGTVVTWGNSYYGLSQVPLTAQRGVTAVAAGVYHTVVLKNDGSVVAWGRNDYGQTSVPVTAQSGVKAIAAGYYHTVVLKTNGMVVAWGYSGLGQTNVPVTAQSGVKAIAAGNNHTVALKTNGMVVAWGENSSGETTVPIAAQSGVIAIAAGKNHTVALKTNGLVVAWGNNYYRQTTVPAGLSGVAAIAAGGWHTVALKTNGLVVAWGAGTTNAGITPNCGQSIVPVDAQSGVTAIAAAYYYTVALKTNGAVVMWGYSFFGATTVPVTAQRGVTAIAAQYEHTVALLGSGRALPVSLIARQSGNEIILSWPTNSVGFVLQSAPSLAPSATWIDLTKVPVVVGTQFTVTNLPLAAVSSIG